MDGWLQRKRAAHINNLKLPMQEIFKQTEAVMMYVYCDLPAGQLKYFQHRRGKCLSGQVVPEAEKRTSCLPTQMIIVLRDKMSVCKVAPDAGLQ